MRGTVPLMTGADGAWTVAVAAQAALGERPVWDDRTGSLVWVDIDGGSLHRFTPGAGDTAVTVARSAGFVALRENGGVVLGTEAGLVLGDATGTVLADPIVPPGMTADHIFNDGAVDGAGRLFAGTVTTDTAPGASALYRLDPDGSVHTVLSGVTESNGVAWSSDGRRMYYADSGGQDVTVFDYDLATGGVSNGRVLIHVEDEDCVPDGLIVDASDNLWIAIWGASCVRCHHPDGRLLRQFDLPTEHITCPAFGGADFGDLYVTSARAYVAADRLPDQPHAGDVFLLRPGARGLPAARYRG
jgi:sugar lactone lactonase YvrE